MKKRKELDALVQGQKLGKRISNKKLHPHLESKVSTHQLLDDSESSDLDDFHVINNQRNKSKKSRARSNLCVASCLPLCLMVLVTTCVVALGTLLWLHLGLREDLDLIRAHLQKVEAQSKETPEALHDYHIQLKNLEFNVTTFAEELKKINAEITTINESVRQLKSVTASLKDSIAAAPEMETMPKDLSSLTESVVNLGSKITQLDSNIKELKSTQSGLKTSAQTLQISQDELKLNVSSLMQMKDEMTNQKGFISSSETSFKDSLMVYVHKEIQVIRDLIEDFNITMTSKMTNFTEWGFYVGEMNDTLNWAMADLTSLHTYVYSNLTAVLQQVRSDGSIPDTTIEQTVLKTLTDTLNNNPVENQGDWKYLLREANRMVNIYVAIAKRLVSPAGMSSSVISSNGSALVELFMNTVVNNCTLDVARLNDTVRLLHAEDGQTRTFQTSVNQTLNQLVNRMNNFSIQLASITNDHHNTQSSKSDNKPKWDAVATPISTTAAEITNEKVTKPVLNPAPNFRYKSLN